MLLFCVSSLLHFMVNKSHIIRQTIFLIFQLVVAFLSSADVYLVNRYRIQYDKKELQFLWKLALSLMVFQTRSQSAASRVFQYVARTWRCHAAWVTLASATRRDWTQAPVYQRQLAGSRQPARSSAARRLLSRLALFQSEKRCRLTWPRWPAVLWFRRTTARRGFSSLKWVQVPLSHWTTCRGPASAHLFLFGVSTMMNNEF